MGSPTLEAVNNALRQVEDPIFRKPLGELGTLLDARVEDGRVWVKIRVSSPSEEAQKTIRQRVDDALEPLDVGFVEVELTVDVPTRETTSTDPIPDVRNVILVMSGNDDREALPFQHSPTENSDFLMKPFGMKDIKRSLERLMGGSVEALPSVERSTA